MVIINRLSCTVLQDIVKSKGKIQLPEWQQITTTCHSREGGNLDSGYPPEADSGMTNRG